MNIHKKTVFLDADEGAEPATSLLGAGVSPTEGADNAQGQDKGTQSGAGTDDSGIDTPSADQEQEKGDSGQAGQEEIKYDIKINGDESLVDDDAVASVVSFAKEHGLTNEVAQSILDNQNAFAVKQQESMNELHNQEVESWKKEIREDKLLGGSHLQATDTAVTAVLAKYAPEGFQDLLIETGLASNPMLIQTLYNISKATSNDTLHLGKGGSSGVRDGSPEAVANRMFPV